MPVASGRAGRAGAYGPRLPDALRGALKARLDARVDADLAKTRELRGEAIDLLSRFVAESPREAREMPEALVRLGELEWENEREGFVARFEQWEQKPVDQRGPAPALDYRVARDLFGRVLREYPWFDQTDLALYIDGFLAFEQGKEDEARERFERILHEYPDSRFVADAHMAKAESIFNGKFDYAGALAEYEKVLGYRTTIDPALYGLALFKSAWCHWRLGNNEEAARRFVGVFEATDAKVASPGAPPPRPGEPAGRGGGESRASATSHKPVSVAEQRQLDELQGEALKYVVEVFSEDEKNTAPELYGFLTKIGGERFSGKIVRALADQFYEQAHYERGIDAYELLLKLEPTSPDAGRWVLEIAAGDDALEDWPRLRATFDRALAQYTAGSAWARAQSDPATVATTEAAIAKTLREDASSLHAKAQRDKTSAVEFEGAAGLYEAYLSKFGKDARAYEVQFALAEVDFFRLGRNVDAAAHYMATARSIPPEETRGPLATLRHDALYNALVALSRAMDGRESGEGARGAPDPTDTYAEALELYARYYPRDVELPAMFYRQGRSFFDRGKYDAAVKIWGMLIERFPSSDRARDAGDSILESFNRAKNYENIETWARRLKALPAFGDPKQQERLDALIVVAVFKQGEQRAAAGDHGGAASAYLRAAKEFPRDTRAAQACVNAEQEAKLAGDVKTLLESAQLAMSDKYAGRPESPVGAWLATSTLQAMGLFGEAADIAERMTALGDAEHGGSPSYARFEHERDAAYDSVVLREATGDHARAAADGARFLALYGSSPEADDIALQLGRAEQNAGRPQAAADVYARRLAHAKNADHRTEGLVLLAQVDAKMGNERAAGAALEQALAFGKLHARELGAPGRESVAHARYMQAERVLARFEEIRIQGDVRQLKARLKEKADLLKEAARGFLECVSFGVAEWTTAALYQIGHMYEAFAKALRDSPPPPEVKSEDQRADYQAQIEEFAVPMEERSLDAYENGWKKAVDLGIYNQWTSRMREALGRLNSELYPPFAETGFEVRSQGPLPLPPLLDAPARAPAASMDPAGRPSPR